MSMITRRPSRPAAPASDWQKYAACAGVDNEIFFPTGNQYQIAADTAAAKRVCRRCPVVAACRTWALENGEDEGVWGGLTEKERRQIHRAAQLSTVQVVKAA